MITMEKMRRAHRHDINVVYYPCYDPCCYDHSKLGRRQRILSGPAWEPLSGARGRGEFTSLGAAQHSRVLPG